LVLQTGVPGEGVNSSCNLGNAASATAAPRSLKPTRIGTINASVEGELLLRQPAVHLIRRKFHATKTRPRILAADAAQAVNHWLLMSAWRVERLSHRQQDAGARSRSILEPFLFWSVIGFYQRRTQSPSLVPKAELLPSISPGKASIGASLNSLFKGICFGG
jgi:hypothetical protein